MSFVGPWWSSLRLKGYHKNKIPKRKNVYTGYHPTSMHRVPPHLHAQGTTPPPCTGYHPTSIHRVPPHLHAQGTTPPPCTGYHPTSMHRVPPPPPCTECTPSLLACTMGTPYQRDLRTLWKSPRHLPQLRRVALQLRLLAWCSTWVSTSTPACSLWYTHLILPIPHKQYTNQS